jgi:hypothetical protein
LIALAAAGRRERDQLIDGAAAPHREQRLPRARHQAQRRRGGARGLVGLRRDHRSGESVQVGHRHRDEPRLMRRHRHDELPGVAVERVRR